MGTYQLTLLINESVSEKDRKELLDAITKQVSKVVAENAWGSKTLAYPINHQEKAFYMHYEFEASPAQIPSLDKSIKFNEDVIRYLLIRKDK